MKVYKVRNKKNGLYSNGGSSPGFTKIGKTWSGIGHAKNHIHTIGFGPWRAPRPEDLEIVEFELTETQVIEAIKVIEEKERKKRARYLR